MPNSFSPSQIEHFKREAKQFSTANGIAHSKALDRIAERYGYSNWSLLMKHNDAPSEVHTVRAAAPFIFVRTIEEMQLAMRVIPPSRGAPSQSEEALRRTESICFNFSSAANAIDFAVAYMSCLLTVPRFRIGSGMPVYHEMRRWLPYCVHPANDIDSTALLVNRHYKPVGLVSRNRVDYMKYPHLHLWPDTEQLKTIAHFSNIIGNYLYADECSPWQGRIAAKKYLVRLLALQQMLQ